MTDPIPLLTLEAQIKRRLRRHLSSLGFTKDAAGHLLPPGNSKECFRTLHAAQRAERLACEGRLIARAWPRLNRYFADGDEVTPGAISPRLEQIAGDTWQSDLFRLASLYWSVPVSQGYGRRLRFLVWDDSNDRLIGLIALGDPVFNLQVRDSWIGWSVDQRRERLVNLMEAYVLGAIPPYNQLLGGKLIASLVRTSEIRDAFAHRYQGATGIISGKKKHAELCLVTTASALGRSAVYNRLRLGGREIFSPLGYTSGWGHFHVPDDLFALMRRYLADRGHEYAGNHHFGGGPNWRLRAVNQALTMVGLDHKLLHHGIERQVFACPFACNFKEALTDGVRPDYSGLSTVDQVAELARARWLVPRSERDQSYLLWRKDMFRAILGLDNDVVEPERSLSTVEVY